LVLTVLCPLSNSFVSKGKTINLWLMLYTCPCYSTKAVRHHKESGCPFRDMEFPTVSVTPNIASWWEQRCVYCLYFKTDLELHVPLYFQSINLTQRLIYIVRHETEQNTNMKFMVRT
jgi:hypothetical protein